MNKYLTFALLLLLLSLSYAEPYLITDNLVTEESNKYIISSEKEFSRCVLSGDGTKTCQPIIMVEKKNTGNIGITSLNNEIVFTYDRLGLATYDLYYTTTANKSIYKETIITNVKGEDQETIITENRVTPTNWQKWGVTLPGQKYSKDNFTMNNKDIVYFMPVMKLGNFQTAKWSLDFKMKDDKVLLDPNITACGLLSANTTYDMNQTIHNNATCFTAGGSNILLDCHGFYIIGNRTAGTNGFMATNDSNHNISIQNCNIANYSTGIYYTFTQNGSIINNTISGSTTQGMYLAFSSTKVVVLNNTVISPPSGMGVYHYNSVNNTFDGNNITGNSYAIQIRSSANNTFNNNIFTYGSNVIYIRIDANNNILTNNIINSSDSGSIGLFMATSKNNTFINNSFMDLENNLYLASNSNNSIFYYNKFYQGSSYNIQNYNETHKFNTTVGGVPQGNYFDNILTANITDLNSDNFGDAGSKYPYNATNQNLSWNGPGNDYGPCMDSTCAALPAGGNLAPTPSLNAPTGNTNYSYNTTWVLLNYTTTDPETNATNCSIYGGTNSTPTTLLQANTSLANGTVILFNWTGLSNQTYWHFINCTDGNLSNVTTTVNFTIKTNIAPNPVLNAPPSNTNYSYNTTEVLLNYTTQDPEGYLTNCSIFGGTNSTPTTLLQANTSLANGTVILFNWTGLSNQTYWHFINCTDGNLSNVTTTVNFTINTLILVTPTVLIYYPLTGIYNTTNLTMQLNYSITNGVDCWFTNCSTGNETVNCALNYFNFSIPDMTDINCSIMLWANSTTGTLINTTVNFTTNRPDGNLTNLTLNFTSPVLPFTFFNISNNANCQGDWCLNSSVSFYECNHSTNMVIFPTAKSYSYLNPGQEVKIINLSAAAMTDEVLFICANWTYQKMNGTLINQYLNLSLNSSANTTIPPTPGGVAGTTSGLGDLICPGFVFLIFIVMLTITGYTINRGFKI